MILGLRGIIKERERYQKYIFGPSIYNMLPRIGVNGYGKGLGFEGILESILSVDEQQEFLLDEKNAEGQYPIHRMIMNHSYFFMETVRAEERK